MSLPKWFSSARFFATVAVLFWSAFAASVQAQTCTSISYDASHVYFKNYFTPSGNAGSFTWYFAVSPANCQWTITNDTPAWITLNSASSGSGNGSISYSYTANSGAGARQGSLTVHSGALSYIHYVIQNTTLCTFQFTSTNPLTAAPAGGGYTATISVNISSCQWIPQFYSGSWVSGYPNMSIAGSGSFNFTVAANNTGSSRTGNFTIWGATSSPSLTINQATLPPPLSLNCTTYAGPVEVGVAYTDTCAGSSGVAPYSYAISAGALPAGLTLNTTTGLISGAPTAAGAYSYTVRVTDSTSPTPQQATRSFSGTVNARLNAPPCAALIEWMEGDAATYHSCTASDGVLPYTFNISTAPPSPWNWSFSANQLVISSNPAPAGTVNASGVVRDAAGATIMLTAGGTVSPRLVLTCGQPSSPLVVGTSYSVQCSATGGFGHYSFAVTAGSIPAGLALSTSTTTATISGTPTAAGPVNFTLTLTSTGSSTSRQVARVFGMSVATPLHLGCIPTAGPERVGTPYNASCTAIGGTPPYSYSIASGVLPNGLSLNPTTGAISGTPTQGGSYSVVVRATDSGTPLSQSAQQSFSGSIEQPVARLSILCQPGTGPTQVGLAYNSNCGSSGGVEPIQFTVAAGALPDGLSLSYSGRWGTVSGTPTTAGQFSYTIRVSDSSAPTPMFAEQVFSGVIAPLASPLSLQCTSTTGPVQVSVAYSSSCYATGGTPPYRLFISSGALPNGLTISTSGGTATISGNPLAPGAYGYTLQLADSSTPTPQTASVAFQGSINPQLVITTVSLPDGQRDQPYRQIVSATGGTGNYAWGQNGGTLPGGLTVESGGAVSGTPANSGRFNFSVQVNDGIQRVSRAFSLNVAPPPTCSFSLNPRSASVAATGDEGTVAVQASAGTCAWSASSGSDWLQLDPDSLAGTGNDAIHYTVSPNATGASRSGVISVQDQQFQVTQDPAPPSTPTLLVSPLQLNSRTVEASAARDTQRIYVFSSGAEFAFTASSSVGWAKLNVTSGVTPAVLSVTFDPADLPAGSTYTAQIEIRADSATPPVRTVGLSFFVELAPIRLSFVPAGLLLSGTFGGGPVDDVLRVRNASAREMRFKVESSEAWLMVDKSEASASSAIDAAITVTADPTGLRPQVHTARVRLSSETTNLEIPIVFTVKPAAPAIRLSQRGLTFTAKTGMVGIDQTFGVLNSGGGLLNWLVSTLQLSGSASWLSVETPDGQATDAGKAFVPMVRVKVDATSLPVGTYSGQVVVTNRDNNQDRQTVSVTLKVLSADSSLGAILSNSGLIFASLEGDTPPAGKVSVISLSKTPLKVYATAQSDEGWFDYAPKSGDLSLPTLLSQLDFTIQPSSGFPAGIREGSLALMFSNNQARQIALLSLVVPRDSAAQANCQPTQLYVVPDNVQSGFSARGGEAFPLEVKVVNNCGQSLTRGSVVAQFTNADPALPLLSLQDGTWTATWQPQNDAQEEVAIRLTATDTRSTARGEAVLAGLVRPNLTTPAINTHGVVSYAAPFNEQAPLAPGALVRIRGAKLAAETATAGGAPLPTQLGDTSVSIGGQPIGLQSVSDSEIVGVLPEDLPLDTDLQVLVQRGTEASLPETVTIASAQPALFSVDGSGSGQGAIAGLTTGVIAQPDAPVHGGETIIILCSNIGAVTTDGTPVNPVSVQIDGRDADVVWAGIPAFQPDLYAQFFPDLAPAFPGIFWIEAVVPELTQPGDSVKVVVAVDGHPSLPVTFAVR